uniref:hypothetical protein n=1 Tax=Collinsella aerofaciens TaxID=74426 RepID=UPI00359C251F
MARITGITCSHVKGINHLVVPCDFYPNKPNFLVAPNGSGKSSLATAFASLNTRRLKVADADRYNGEDWDDSFLSLTFDDGVTLSANADSNEIASRVDVQVVRSGLYANMTNRRVGPRVLSQTKMSVQHCVLYEKVPATVRLNYSVTAVRQKYASVLRGRMDNLAEEFKSYEFLSEFLSCDAAFKATTGSRYAAAINNFFKGVISLETGMGGDITEAEVLSYISSVKPLISIKEILDRRYPAKGDISNYVNAIQVNRFIEGKRNEIKEACSYLRFRKIKNDINEMLPLLNRTRFGVEAKVRSHQLVVDFPDWDDASNGEIDVLQLCVALFRARARFGEKKNALLLIDEVFDYLDDANLLVAQHFLLEMMKQFKNSGKNLYVIILTHLDPGLFKSFRFKSFHTSYIPNSGGDSVKGCLNRLLVDRKRCQKELPDIYNSVSSHYLHFSDCDKVSEDILEYIAKQRIEDSLKSPSSFRSGMEAKLGDYFSGKPFAPSEVCCGIRLAVERLSYERLAADDKPGFLVINTGTEDRLRYASEHGVEVPETFHLLGSIYNSCMHLAGRPGETELVQRELGNNIIRHMIETSLKEFGWE